LILCDEKEEIKQDEQQDSMDSSRLMFNLKTTSKRAGAARRKAVAARSEAPAAQRQQQ
jgi:hypothetical protein